MKIFGYEFAKATKAVEGELVEKQLQPVWGQSPKSLWGLIREPFAGAWQKNMEIESTANILAFHAVYACVRLIAFDISKLRIKLVELRAGVWQEVTSQSPFQPVLRKPNSYQNRIQFLMQWVISKLLYGNTYVLKQRDERRVVTALYVLDPKLVTPLVTEEGDVYYELKRDDLSQLGDNRIILPASEIIHDRMLTLFHPLVGISPLYAAGSAATQGIRIQANSEQFFQNMSRPSFVLTAPGAISADTAKRLKESTEANFGGANLGRVLVAGDGLKAEVLTIPAADAQLIEQLKMTGEMVASAFGVPPHKIGLGQPPTFNNIAALNQDYYSQTLQQLMESIELCLDEGLGLVPAGYGTALDDDNLLRLDQLTRADVNAKELNAGYRAPNEARQTINLPPTAGGDTPYMQQQMVPLQILEAGPQKPQPPLPTATPAPPIPTDERAFAEFKVFIGQQLTSVAEGVAAQLKEVTANGEKRDAEALAELNVTRKQVEQLSEIAKTNAVEEDQAAKLTAALIGKFLEAA